MKHTTELKSIIGKHFGWHKSRVDCFAKMMLALFQVRTVNLQELAIALADRTKLTSRYRRVQRLIHYLNFSQNSVAKFVINLFAHDQDKWYLALDRTDWRIGKKGINILVLSLVYKKTAFPLYWSMLKIGSSSTHERIELLNRFVTYFGSGRIAGLLADREFIGKEWFAWLQEQNIPFFIRIRNNMKVYLKGGMKGRIGTLLKVRSRCKQTLVNQSCTMANQTLFVTATYSVAEQAVAIISNVCTQDALTIYSLRWNIETLFASLKSRGFRFEDTHISRPDRISRIIVLLTLCFSWAYKVGQWVHEHGPGIKLKKNGYREYSLFRYGLDYIRDAIYKSRVKLSFTLYLLWQSPTPRINRVLLCF